MTAGAVPGDRDATSETGLPGEAAQGSVGKADGMADKGCPGTVLQAPAPVRLIEGGLPTEAMVAHVLVARYADHLPLYRQAQPPSADDGAPGCQPRTLHTIVLDGRR